MKTIPSSKSNGSQGVFIFIGQAGCQTGSALWQLFNTEHSIQPDGFGYSDNSYKSEHICFYKDSTYYKDDPFHRDFCYYEVEKNGKFVPRTVFLDLEPSVIDEIKTGSYRNLFSEDWSFHEYSKVGDGAGIFSRAYNTIGRCIISNIMNAIRRIAERSEQLNVINIARSYGGATGSGLGSLLLENLRDKYPKILLSEVNILNYSDGRNPTIEPYNTILGIESSCSSGDITFLYNNSALKDICFNRLRIKQPLYYHMNELICHGISGVFSSERFPGYGSCNMNSILTNLIPYPRIQFAVCSMSPILPKGIMKYEPYYKPIDMINDLLSSKNTLFDINFRTGSFISCCNIYRGSVSPFDISNSHHLLMSTNKVKMVEWNPRGIKNGHSPLNIVEIPDFNLGVSHLHIAMLSNHSNISESLTKECLDVHIMLKKKAFLHWYIEHGMEIDDFKNALENAMLLSLDYKELDISPDYGLKLVNISTNSKSEISNKLYNKQRIEKDNIELLSASFYPKVKNIQEVSLDSIYNLLEQSLKEGGSENFDNVKNILASMSNEERENLISIAKSKGIDTSFLENFGEGNITYLDLKMYQTLSTLLDIKESTTDILDKIVSKPNQMMVKCILNELNHIDDKVICVQNAESHEENLELIKTLIKLKGKDNALQAISELIINRIGNKDSLISLLRSLGIDEIDFMIKSIENEDVDINNIDTFNTLMNMIENSIHYMDVDRLVYDEVISPEYSEMYSNRPYIPGQYGNAIETIQGPSVDFNTAYININQVLCALSTRRSYEESFVSCISPKTSLSKVNDFHKHHAKLKIEFSKSCHNEKEI